MSKLSAIVIGGGVMGTSAALHLLRAGADVTLLERDGVAQATSAAGAGFVDPWTAGAPSGDGGAEEMALADYGIDFYRSLHELAPESPYRQRGLIWMAATEDDWPYVEPRLTKGPSGAKAMEPQEIEALTHGVVRAEGIFRGVLRPRSVQISAERATVAMARVFTDEGGHLHERTPVLELLASGGRITGIRTPGGVLSADVVVLAAGAWSSRLLEPLGIFLPLAPRVVSRIVTEPLDLPGDLPLLFIRSQATGMPRSYWLREEDGRLMYGTVYDTPARFSFVGAPVPERFDQVDLDGVLALQEGAKAFADAIPAVIQHRNMRLAHGAPVFTPDGRSIIGRPAGVDNLHLLAGCNEQGVTNAPGFGRVIAEMATTGSTDFVDPTVWTVDRFDVREDTVRAVADAIA